MLNDIMQHPEIVEIIDWYQQAWEEAQEAPITVITESMTDEQAIAADPYASVGYQLSNRLYDALGMEQEDLIDRIFNLVVGL